MRLSSRIIIIVSCLVFYENAYAIPDNESIPEYIPSNFLKVTSYVDVSYNYLLRSNKFVSKIFDRNNDIQENGFTLQQAMVTLAAEPDQGLGAVATFILGRDAYQNTEHGIDSNAFGMRYLGLASPQAYLRYKNNDDIIKIGLINALAGIEQFDYTQDLNFSRSILDGYAQPGSHIGVRLLHKVNDELSVIAGIGNGWNTVKQAYKQNTIIGGVNYAIYSKLSFMIDMQGSYQYLTDRLSSGQTNWRNLLDVFGTWNVTEKLSLSANYDYGFQTKAALPNKTIARATWQGIAGYVDYEFNDKWRTAVRGEFFTDTDGYRTGVKQNWRELTLTLGHQPIKSLLIWAETRHDFSNVNSFLNKSGTNTSNNQQSYALNVLYQFS